MSGIFGGGKTQVTQPTPPPAPPTVSSGVKEYADAFPRLVELQRQYGPELAAMDFQQAQQYGPQYSQLLADIDKQLYPQTASLQENLASQAIKGMNEPMPQELQEQFISDFNAGIGGNVNAPIGITNRNTALLNLQKQWQDYYRNLGLSAANRQPLQGAQLPAQQQQFQLPASNALGFQQGTYGSYAGAVAGQNVIAQPKSNPASSIMGLIGGIGGAFLGGPTGAAVGYGIGSSL